MQLVYLLALVLAPTSHALLVSTPAVAPIRLFSRLFAFRARVDQQASPGPSVTELETQFNSLMNAGVLNRGRVARVQEVRVLLAAPRRDALLNPEAAQPCMYLTLSPHVPSCLCQHMATDLVTLSPETSLSDASCALVQHGITGAPVVEKQGARTKVVGMLSQTDMLYKMAGHRSVPITISGAASVRYASNTKKMRKALAGDCRGAMSTDVVDIYEGESIQEAAALLLKHKVSRLPVVDESKNLVGIITTSDVMQLAVADPQGCGLLM